MTSKSLSSRDDDSNANDSNAENANFEEKKFVEILKNHDYSNNSNSTSINELQNSLLFDCDDFDFEFLSSSNKTNL